MLVTLAVVALQLAVALPFLIVSPAHVRGVPGPLLVAITLAACYALDIVIGVALMAVAVILAVTTLDASPYAMPVVWIPAAAVVAVLGNRERRGQGLRRQVLDELRAGLVALSDAPRIGRVGIAVRYVPTEDAQVLAADFYGVIETRGGGVAVLVGDVAGHGPRAAAVATHLRATWRGLARAGIPGEDIVSILNESLHAEQSTAPHTVSFATLCVATIDARGDRATIVMAGHLPPILVSGAEARECDVRLQPLIGVLDNHDWQPQTIDLPDGPWSLLFYTDGLVEGRGPDGRRPLGTHQLLPTIGAVGPIVSEKALDTILATVERANGGPLQDDIVMLAVSRG